MSDAEPLGVVLLLEDEPAHVELILAGFEDSWLKADVRPVDTVAKARQALVGGGIDLVIADWRLPDGDGLTFLRDVAPHYAVPVVLMTSHGDERLAVEVMRAGAVDYVVKSSAALLDLPHTAARALREARQRSELRETRLALGRTEASLEAIVRAVPDVIYRLDVAGRITFISHAVTRYGWQPDELLGRHVTELVHPDDRERVARRLAERRTGDRASALLEFRLLTSTAEARVFEVHSQPLELPVMQANAVGLYASETPCTQAFMGTQGIARDVTDRKESEARLLQLAAAVEGSTDGLLIAGADQRAVFANQAWETITGIPLHEQIGRDWRLACRATPGFEGQPGEPELSQGQPWAWRGNVELASGHPLVVEASGTPMSTEGVVTGYLIRLTDVTSRSELERQLEQAVRLEALATLAGGIAHDFNNVLAAIMGYVELALLNLPDPCSLRDDLEQVATATQRAADLTRQILTFARQSDAERSPMYLDSMVKEALKLLRATLPPNLRVIDRIDRDLPTVRADATQMHQVLMNLCTNAAAAMGDGPGTLTVRLTRTAPPDGDTRHGEAWIRLDVEDTGCGIPEDLAQRVFEPFFTTKPVGQGTGMGLAIVHGIVRGHGGRIAVDSRLGEGTTFTVCLPASEGALPPLAARTPDLRGQGRVLVVEDETGLATVMQRMLENCGYEVNYSNDPLDALDRFGHDPSGCDVVVTDLLMPRMNGIELVRRLRAQRPELPVVIVTGYASEDALREADTLDVAAVLRKPVRLAELADAVRFALAQARH